MAAVCGAGERLIKGVEGALRSRVGTSTVLGMDSPEVGETRGRMVLGRYPHAGDGAVAEDLDFGDWTAAVATPTMAAVGVIPIRRRIAVTVLDTRSDLSSSPHC